MIAATVWRGAVPPSEPDPLRTIRAAVVLLLALIAGPLAIRPAYLADHSLPVAALVGGSAAVGARWRDARTRRR
jgi:hypothetical protein